MNCFSCAAAFLLGERVHERVVLVPPGLLRRPRE